jgi:hypothetical protein
MRGLAIAEKEAAPEVVGSGAAEEKRTEGFSIADFRFSI